MEGGKAFAKTTTSESESGRAGGVGGVKPSLGKGYRYTYLPRGRVNGCWGKQRKEKKKNHPPPPKKGGGLEHKILPGVIKET